jgi:hypothetical protein
MKRHVLVAAFLLSGCGNSPGQLGLDAGADLSSSTGGDLALGGDDLAMGGNDLAMGGNDLAMTLGDMVVPPDLALQPPDLSQQCTPSTATCTNPGTLQACDVNGVLASPQTCAFGCNPGPSSGTAYCQDCAPASLECSGDDLVTCDAAGHWAMSTATTCPLGCNSSATPRCLELVPANLPPDTCDIAPTMDFSPSTSLSIDTGACSFTIASTTTRGSVLPQNGPSICTFKFNHVLVPSGVTITATGPNALAIVAAAAMDIEGTINVSAVGTANGPGASDASGLGCSWTYVCQCGTSPGCNVSSGAGGGAGYATGGGASGNCSSYLNANTPACPPSVTSCMGGGGTYGSSSLMPLRAGATGGAANSNCSQPPAAGGGGGGALELVSCGAATFGAMAVLDAGGGGGKGGASFSGGGGGGSGGAILIESASASIAGVAAANGGGGGAGSASNISTTFVVGQNGQDGPPTATPAAGGNVVCANGSIATNSVSPIGQGGKGGAASAGPTGGAPTNNWSDSSSPCNGLWVWAGGGGGSVGVIHIDVRAGTSAMTSGATISPAPTSGAVATK